MREIPIWNMCISADLKRNPYSDAREFESAHLKLFPASDPSLFSEEINVT